MSFPTRISKWPTAWIVLGASLLCAVQLAANTLEDEFLAANDAAMAKMHAAMDIRPTGDIDRDFVAMMIPHHQGGIDMAIAQLRYGRNEPLRRLAQEIIVEQQQEIAAMRMAVGDPLPDSIPSPTTTPPGLEPSALSPDHHHTGKEP